MHVMAVFRTLTQPRNSIYEVNKSQQNLIKQSVDLGGLQGPVYTKMLRPLCNDANDTVLILNNGVTPEWGCNLFSSELQSYCSIDA